VTGADGVAHFTTIYPGWYRGRAVHIHFKIRSSASATAAYEFTSQLFFDDALTDRVHVQQPYAAKGQRDLRTSSENAPPAGGAFASLTGAEQR
jgi:protocatechuate 3,4-dioxygenase beta subunit